MQPLPAANPARRWSEGVRIALLLWGVIIVVSPSSEVIFQIAAGAVPAWLPWARIAVLIAVYAAGIWLVELRALRHFCIAYGFTLAAVTALGGASGGLLASHGFISGMLRLQLIDIGIAATLLVLIWRLHGRRDRIYFGIGKLTATFGPSWLRIGHLPLRWRLAGPLIGIGGGVCVLAYVRYTGLPVANPKPMLVLWALLIAAMNAFAEESTWRNGLLSSLEPHFGARQAILASAVMFGVGHWNSLPYGVTGVVMTMTLGYFAAKAMIETKGMFWSWFMHFIPDCVIFYYWAMGTLQRHDWGI